MVSVQGDVMRFLFFQGLLRNRAEVGENEALNGQSRKEAVAGDKLGLDRSHRGG